MNERSEPAVGLRAKTARHPLIRKLSNFTVLSVEECDAIESATTKVAEFAAGDDVIQRGDRTGGVNLLLEGFACRYKILEDGRRQILAYLVPGDLCDLHVFLLRRMDHSIGALSRSKVAVIPQSAILGFTNSYPNLTRALWWTTLLDEAITREWVVNIGQRTAYERMAHLFCELFHRLHAIGETAGKSYPLPVTQATLGDTLGLSNVHINRTLQDLRRDGLISFNNGTVTIKNLAKLEAAAFFNPDYLHLLDAREPFA
ncbi:Crp/Fnr family transcriptional regulator [Mesorhizobium sp. B2-4-2]|uniref:Crp/Fnr family transcriptional regulator n=1 Tax=unclassified Mesorhizobium TaxID=325217 RepID=UPI001125E105|nr:MULTISPECIES: Crp/Fnr family transcriptional regulator [unclassified Mesorhizobium]MBZ9961469.1 Crp/Fnr family transcriptional regulator [Mesorhizobium sp. BR1-1-14]TPL45547.1 Crp/Fnr family transcriptional regulator [Mesorhizobium sp. B2-4-4]TPL61312.1 Crp/Fnr family transcriptional regulator [Mesorhizobium sp. B2-4-2]